MKKPIGSFITLLLGLCLVPVYAQPGGRGMTGMSVPEWSASMTKLFGDNPVFSAAMEHQTKGGSKDVSIKGKMSFDNGKSRTEIDMSSVMSQLNPGGLEQMKAMGLSFEGAAQITRPDKNMNYTVYPEMKAYTEEPMKDPDAGKGSTDFKIESTELGKETMDGRACIKNKHVVTDKDGKQHEFIVWNATDLNKFPVRVETTERGTTSVILFKDVKLVKPDAALFELPSGCERYNSIMELMMKRMGGAGAGTPPR